MNRIAYDSVNPFAIPRTAEIAWGYSDGRFRWSQAGRERFDPKRTWLGMITVTGEDPHADAADVETEDLTPSGVLSWLKFRRHVGITKRPTIYAPGSLWADIDRLCEPEFGGHYYRWLADPDPPNLPAGTPHTWKEHPFASVQYFWGKNYDLTLVPDRRRYVVS
jgi:hypothetical protein